MFEASNLAVLAFAAAAGGGGYMAWHAMQSEPGVYAQPAEEVYSRLATADLQFVDSHFDSFRFSVSGNGRDKIVWQTEGMRPERSCTITLTPYGDETHAGLACSQPLADAAPMVRLRDELFRNAVAEMVEARITGKPIPPLDRQMFEGAVTALKGGGSGFNRALSDAVVTKQAIDQQLAAMSAAQDPQTLEDQSLDAFYDQAAEPEWAEPVE